ncbi:MAG: GIY-YIG nuclease family protein, partial [Candidatus Liptonbacteria bacterium]
MKIDTKKFYRYLPNLPGVYLMRGNKNRLLYVGKATNLRRRVSSYFLRPLEMRLAKMVAET